MTGFSGLPVERGLLYRSIVVLFQPPFSKFRSLFLTNVGLQILDGHLTVRGLAAGFAEGNPLVRRLIEAVGPLEGIFAVKLLAIAGLFLLYRRGRHPITIAGLASLAVVYLVGAIVPWTLLLSRG